jgi:hypothetical protein
MSEQHAALLKKARERLIEDRRDLAKTIAAPFEREKTRDARNPYNSRNEKPNLSSSPWILGAPQSGFS